MISGKREKSKECRINPNLVLVIGVVGVSCSAIFVRYSEAPALVTATGRLVWTVFLLTPSALGGHRRDWKAVRRKDVFWCALSGVFLAFHFVFWFASLRYTSVASSTALMSTEVIFTALGFLLFLNGRIEKGAWGCILVSFAGSVVIGLADGGSGSDAVLGDFLSLLGAVCITGYTLIGRRERERLSNTAYTYLTYGFCALALLFLDGVTGTPVTGWGVREIGIGFCLGFFCTLLGHSLFNWCLKYLNPAYVAAAKLCEPIAASVIAVFLFGEIPSALQFFGASVLLAGVFAYAGLERKGTAC
ncbi:MAG: DMT family transporter [Lachnospiraceae bacterium]|nr:DMT family transporter [Lachnospiraceae bacterium]